MEKIKTVSELQNMLNNKLGSAKGQFVAIHYETDLVSKYNKMPSGMRATKENKALYKIEPSEYKVEKIAKFNFATDYEKKMAKVLEVDTYEAHAPYEHLVPNVLKRNLNTNKCSLIVMFNSVITKEIRHGDHIITEEEIKALEPYKKPSKNSLVNYFNLGLSKVTKICIENEEYLIDIQLD